MEAFVQSDVAQNLIECLGVRIVKMTSVGKSFQELFANAHVASALDAANTVLSAHFQWAPYGTITPRGGSIRHYQLSEENGVCMGMITTPSLSQKRKGILGHDHRLTTIIPPSIQGSVEWC